MATKYPAIVRYGVEQIILHSINSEIGMTYNRVVKCYPQYKDKVDSLLTERGYEYLIPKE